MNPVFSITKNICYILTLLVTFSVLSCSSTQQNSTMIYPKKPADTENRKAGAAMLLYEQAEKDLDVNDSVIVIPPDEQRDSSMPQKE